MRLENLRLQELKKEIHDNPHIELISQLYCTDVSSVLVRQTRSGQSCRLIENRRFLTSAGAKYADMCFGLEIIKMWHFYERQPTKFFEWHFDDRNESASCAVKSAAKATWLPAFPHQLGFIPDVLKSHLTLYKPLTQYIYPNRYIGLYTITRVTRTSAFRMFGVLFVKKEHRGLMSLTTYLVHLHDPFAPKHTIIQE